MIWEKRSNERRQLMIYSTPERAPTRTKCATGGSPTSGETKTQDHLYQWILIRRNSGLWALEKATATTVGSPDIGRLNAPRSDRQEPDPSQLEDLEGCHVDPSEDPDASISGPWKTTLWRQKTSSRASGLTRPTRCSTRNSP